MQFDLAHFDRWIAPDEVDPEFGIDVVRSEHFEVRHVQSLGIASGEFAGAGVHVDGDDSSPGTTAGESQGDGAGAASEVDEDSVLGRRWGIGEKELRSRIESTVREDAVIGFELESIVGKDGRHEARS